MAISLMPFGAYAAGLGKVTVLSPLGQPLRAEVDVTASREELSSMTAKVASPNAFQQAGIEYSPTMTGIRVMLDKRPNGQPFLRVSSDRAINDPFLDLLLELNWSSGRMVREYTMLLDPPEALRVAPSPASVVAPVAKAPPRIPAAVAQPAPIAEQPAPAQPPQPMAAAPKQPTEQANRQVKSGDTLAKIAGETKPEGVSLDQMLVALFRGNRDAFDGGNMNRLKSGKILTVPTQAEAAAISTSDAHKTVVAQAADFNAYRRKLAGTVAAAPAAKEEAPKQEATGKIAPKVEEKAAPVSAKDKLEVSRTEAAKSNKEFQSRITALEEDLVARDKALKEAGSRIAELEKNLGDLKKLAELKSQAGAQLQQQAQAAKPAAPVAPVPEVKKPEPTPAPAKAPAPAEAAKVPPSAPAEAPKLAEKPAEAAPAPAAAVQPEAAAPKPAEAPAPAPQPPVKPAPAPAPVVEEPSFIDENGMLVYGGGAVLVALLGYLGFASMRRRRASEAAPTTSRITEGDLMANSVFGSTGGQAVDTGASIQTDFSQSNLTSIDADEGVDPVAEADVYMAYGRDAQAEEILIDALKNDPTRHAIHLKLLEIYSGRKSLKQFESLATDLYGLTNGAGPDWEKAAGMGRALDPDNPLYGGKLAAEAGHEQAAPASEPAPALVVPPSEVEKLRDTVSMPGQLGLMASGAEVHAESEPPTAMDFDLDLGAGTTTDIAKAKEEAPMDLNLEIGLPHVEGAPMDATVPMGMRMTEPTVAAEPAGLDFEFDLDETAASPATTKSDLITDIGTEIGAETAPKLDLSAINLELGASPELAASDQDDPDVTTKIELAQAYEEMGDKEGARELLQEVVQEGSNRQKEIARDKLALLEA